MKDQDPIYKRFWTALTYEAARKWHRQKSTLAAEAGIKPSSLTAILNGDTKAKYGNRKALAKACDYDYEEFLEHGKVLMQALKDSRPTKQITSPPEKKSNPKSIAKSKKGSSTVGDKMMNELLQVYKDQTIDLKNQVADLKQQHQEWNKERQLMMQDLREERLKSDKLIFKNLEIAKKLGEANQELNKLKAQQADGLGSQTHPAANQ